MSQLKVHNVFQNVTFPLWLQRGHFTHFNTCCTFKEVLCKYQFWCSFYRTMYREIPTLDMAPIYVISVYAVPEIENSFVTFVYRHRLRLSRRGNELLFRKAQVINLNHRCFSCFVQQSIFMNHLLTGIAKEVKRGLYLRPPPPPPTL